MALPVLLQAPLEFIAQPGRLSQLLRVVDDLTGDDGRELLRVNRHDPLKRRPPTRPLAVYVRNTFEMWKTRLLPHPYGSSPEVSFSSDSYFVTIRLMLRVLRKRDDGQLFAIAR